MRQIPYDGHPPSNPLPSKSLIVKLIVLLVLVIGAFQSISVYVESLWFGSLGFVSVYWYQFKAQSATFGAFFLATTIILWVMFRLVGRNMTHKKSKVPSHNP